jgi:glycosyltransferase involved in cell wall biosynthesis
MMNHGVIYSIATKFGSPGLGTVSYNAVKALLDERLLRIAVSYGNKSDLPESHLLTLPGNPSKLLFFLPKRYYKPLRKGFLDYVVSTMIAKKGCDIFHGWNNQALRSIRAAKKIGARTILECGSTHRFFREKLLNEEYERFGIKNVKTPEYARQSSLEEIDLSDFIFLPSEFAKKTFIDSEVKENKLFVIKRGVNPEKFRPTERGNKRFRVLFVGRLSLRKGIQYLLEAWAKIHLKDAELVLVGSVDNTMKPVLSRYRDIGNTVFKGFLKDPSGMYQESTIFVFPSLEEGSAKVTYEAMAAGLPVITTENSGSVVRNGLDGFIIPIRDSEAIREKIHYLYENREMREMMRANALEYIKQYTWQNYRSNLVQTYTRLPL